ncbi:GNAT family N-acetyltransferase [Actinacidiphila yeochonensis]|uniref:GNAT family N-acetyltransferase n=1 Tax=Actinacidiphila yeochonensis TaxID=89050 RepID=UPI00055E8A3C|nr:GNAT family N-acetyltransferase [Actinacidiphila yeochonensis]
MTTIETPRLVLRRWREEDVEPYAAVNADPEVMRWIGDGSVRDTAETRAHIERIERLWETEGFGLFAVELRDTGEFAGFTGLSVPHFLPAVMPAVEVGWRLGRRFWGRGLATEAARASVRFAFREAGLPELLSLVRAGNAPSANVTRKLGMRLSRELVSADPDRTVRVYALSAVEYATRSGDEG